MKWNGIGICIVCRGDYRPSLTDARRSVDRGVPNCPACDGVGLIGVRPDEPTAFGPGSTHKVGVLVARYAAGIPLWLTGDEREHFDVKVKPGAISGRRGGEKSPRRRGVREGIEAWE